MEKTDIQELVQHGTLYNQAFDRNIQETHISWVVFTADFALKIKKPVKLSFLDFSTLELRKYFCEQEVTLNSRFSDIYLAVVALGLDGEKWVIENGKQTVLDYGVVMIRQKDSLRMDHLLSKKKVSQEAICQLARQVADFHNDAGVISTPFHLIGAKGLFRDLRSISGNFEITDSEWPDFIEVAIRFSDEFLTKNQNLFITRAKAGQIRDVHGDLHSRNIFMNPEPVIFDCIEFNASFRQIDVWYEVAFLCMDMEFYGHLKLSEVFFNEYNNYKGELVIKENRRIFIYFKLLRANVRAKVLALEASQGNSPKSNKGNLYDSIRYLQLMREYIKELVKS